MGLPKAPEARPYYRAAKQRYDDAYLLLSRCGRTNGAVYLAGYTVECMYKALILDAVPKGTRRPVEKQEFRGRHGHDIEGLRSLYRNHGGGDPPKDVLPHLIRVASWTTDMRYLTGVLPHSEADAFLESVVKIASWADGRL